MLHRAQDGRFRCDLDTLKFVLSGDDEDIAAVKLTLDGEEVKAEDQNGRGVYTYTVNFEDVLNDWKRANGVAGASSDSSGDSDSGLLLQLGFLERRLQHQRPSLRHLRNMATSSDSGEDSSDSAA